MDNIEVHRLLGDTPFMTLDQADILTKLISKYHINDILELGFAHGVSTCYFAAALARQGNGRVVSIDNDSARKRSPNIETLLDLVGEKSRVDVYYEPTSYNWRLLKFLEQNPRPTFDMCYVDGAHNWFVDGFAFFLVDLLLKPGGWIVFDDLNWTYEKSPGLSKTKLVEEMPIDEKTTPQIRKIYELLIRTHPKYHNFSVRGGWAFAQKKLDTENKSLEREVVVEKIIEVQKEREYLGVGWFLMRLAKKIIAR